MKLAILALLLLAGRTISAEEEFRCWTVLNAPGGDYQVCTTVTYL
jgi:hypothetical protein